MNDPLSPPYDLAVFIQIPWDGMLIRLMFLRVKTVRHLLVMVYPLVVYRDTVILHGDHVMLAVLKLPECGARSFPLLVINSL